MKHAARTSVFALALAATSLLAAPRAWAADWLRPSTAPSGASATEVAARFVAAEGRVALRLDDATLTHASTLKLGRGAAVRFAQRHRGVLVDGRSVALRVSPDGRVRGAMVDVARGLDVDTTPAVSVVDAYEMGALQLPFSVGRMVRHELVVMTTGATPALAWRIDVLDARGGGRLYVDAHDGTLRGYRTLARTARGLVYEQNSVTTPDPIEVTLDTLDTEADPIRLRGWGGLLEVTNYVSGGQQSGYEVEQTVGPTAGEDFLHEPPASATDEDDAFSQVGLFYHLTEHRSFFRDELGVDVDRADWKITAVANMREEGAPLDNAFFSSAGLDGTDFDAPNLIGIGQGTEVDFASDSDVFKHEFGHYVSEQAVGYNLGQLGVTEFGLSPHSGSVDEGIADYFACTENGDPILGEATLDTFGSARDLTDASKTCPTEMLGEVHADGEIVGSLGWTLRENFGRTIADQLVWGAVSLMPIGGSLGDFAAGIAETAQELLEAGDLDADDVAGIDAFIAERGLHECGHVIPLRGEEPRSSSLIGLDLAGQAFGASCDDLQAFGLELQSIFHFSGSAPDADAATFHMDLQADGPGDVSYRLLVRAGQHVSFSNGGGFLPVPDEFDYEVVSEGDSLDLVIDASSDPPFDPGATYFAVVMTQSCPNALFDISLRSGGSGAGGGDASGATASVGATTGPGSSAASGVAPTTSTGEGSAVGAGGAGADEATAEGDGCDCRATPGAPLRGSAGVLALALAGALVAARRRR